MANPRGGGAREALRDVVSERNIVVTGDPADRLPLTLNTL